MPVALNCWFEPSAMLGFVGPTEMVESVAAVTVSVVDPLIVDCGSVAVIVVVPCATEVARPSLPDEFEMVAVLVVDEVHVTDVVRSCVVLSL